MLNNKPLIKEVCVKLGLRIEMINDVFKYIHSFSKTKFTVFADEVIISTAIYLSNIINVLYFVVGKYDKIKEFEKNLNLLTDEQIYVLKVLIEDDYIKDQSVMIQMIPNLTLEKVNWLYKQYSILRDEILKAEQHLLRIINYEFESKTKELYLMLLNYADILDFDQTLIQLSWNILNDWYLRPNQKL